MIAVNKKIIYCLLSILFVCVCVAIHSLPYEQPFFFLLHLSLESLSGSTLTVFLSVLTYSLFNTTHK